MYMKLTLEYDITCIYHYGFTTQSCCQHRKVITIVVVTMILFSYQLMDTMFSIR